MTINLARDVQDFLRHQVRDGVCSDASELVNDIVRSFSEQQHQAFKVTPELEDWLLESASQPTTPLTGDDFKCIRERVQTRKLSSHA